MSNVLITGGLGFVGGRLCRKLAQEHGVYISSRKKITTDELNIVGAKKALYHTQLLHKDTFPKNVDTVIHLAALNEWDCVKYPSEAIRVNVDETRIVLENAIAAGVQHFIYFSTAHIYGSPLQGTIDENTLPRPIHPYAITHKAAEDYVLAAYLQNKIHGIVVRLSNSFGAPVLPAVNRWTLLLNDLSRQAVEKKQLSLLSNGCQYRDFVCLTDVEDVVGYMIKHAKTSFDKGIYNLGSGASRRVIDMAEKIVLLNKELFNEILPVQLPPNAPPTREPALHYSVNRLAEAGGVIKNNVDEELKLLLIFCSENFKKID